MKKLLTATLLLCAFASCGPATQIEKSWLDPVQTTRFNNFKKVLVVVFAQSETSRRVAEEMLAKELGPTAVASYNYSSISSKAGDADAIADALKKDGFDGAIVTRLIDKEKETTYVPGRVSYPFYGGFRGYYRFGYGAYVEPGYYIEDKIYYVETNAYDLLAEKLLWSGVTRTTNPGQLNKVLQGFATVVVNQMKKDGFIKP